jgi:hypothetical protein
VEISAPLLDASFFKNMLNCREQGRKDCHLYEPWAHAWTPWQLCPALFHIPSTVAAVVKTVKRIDITWDMGG